MREITEREEQLITEAMLRQINRHIDAGIERGERLHVEWITTAMAADLKWPHPDEHPGGGAARLGLRRFVHEELLKRTDYPRQHNPIDWDRIETLVENDYIDLCSPWMGPEEHQRAAEILMRDAERLRAEADALRRYANIKRQHDDKAG